MTQLFNISIDGVDVTSENNGCSISEEMNRMYDVAAFTLDYEPELELDVVIHYGTKTFNGFVFSCGKTGKNSWRVEVRTQGAKLTEPYSAHTETFDAATTSHALCDLYASQSGMPINNTAGNLTFGGSYERKGTMLSALTNIANVTGAEFWDDGSSIQIQPNKAITEDGVEVSPGDIFDFVESNRTIYNRGVGFITVRNGGSEANDIIAKNNIYAEIDECTGEIFVYPSPNGTMEHTKGVSPLTPVSKSRTETSSVLDETVITLDGAVKSISSVTLNGTPVSDYHFVSGYNVVYFNTLKRGMISISYVAYAQRGFVNISQTKSGRFVSLDMFYLDQVLKFQGFLSEDCSNNTASDGDMTCIAPSEMIYPKGFDLYTIGGDPEFTFYDKNKRIIRPVSSSNTNYISIENASLEEDGGTYRYATQYPIGTARGAKSAGTSIPYTTEVDGETYYFKFTQYYPKIEVSYETPAKKHHIKFSNIHNGEISMMVQNRNTGDFCEYDLEGIDYDDLRTIPCELGQNVPVDVAGLLGMEATEVSGKTMSYVAPNNSSGSTSADSFGSANIYVFMDGDYVIDSSSVKPRTTITLTSNVNG